MTRSKDPALTQIEALRAFGHALTFSWLRNTFAAQKSTEVYSSLDYGKAIIESEDQLNQYLYSYGPMVQSQWAVASNFLTLEAVGPTTRWIDYGCGQGLAGLLLFERLGPKLFRHVRTIVLVEPSPLALARATAIYEAMAPQSDVVPVEKNFTQLRSKDLKAEGAENTIHIFSNVLDISGYDHLKLFEKALSPGRHTILAVGNDREFDGGTPNIRMLKTAVEHPSMSGQISVVTSTLDQFKCGNRDEPAVVWHCQLNVRQ
jgi:hypothetical protein